MIGFIYLWRDRKHHMVYLGAHVGQPDDGYICSAKWPRFWNAYKKRPEDFKRRIIERIYIDNVNVIRNAEQRWLNFIKQEEIGIRYYNLNLVAAGFDRQTAIKGGLAAQAKLSPEQRVARMRKVIASMSPEQRSDRSRKRAASIPLERRTIIARRNAIASWIKLSPEQRSARGRKATFAANTSLSSEQRSINAHKAALNLSLEQRVANAANATKAAANLSPERLSDRVRKAWANLSLEQRVTRARNAATNRWKKG